MKIFPTNNYRIELNEDFEHYIEVLKNNTKESLSLSSQVTDKKFIGKIDDNNFKLIGSERGIGAFTVFTGTFNKKQGTIKTEINKPFKVLISILLILPVIPISLAVINNGFIKSIGLLVPLLMSFLFIRFVFVALANKFSTNLTIQKLKITLSLNSLEKTADNKNIK